MLLNCHCPRATHTHNSPCAFVVVLERSSPPVIGNMSFHARGGQNNICPKQIECPPRVVGFCYNYITGSLVPLNSSIAPSPTMCTELPWPVLLFLRACCSRSSIHLRSTTPGGRSWRRTIAPHDGIELGEPEPVHPSRRR